MIEPPPNAGEVILTPPEPAALFARSATLHADRLCPRQVLGVRIGLYARALLDLRLPRDDKRLLVFVETDGCFADGLAVATGCRLGRRTLLSWLRIRPGRSCAQSLRC